MKSVVTALVAVVLAASVTGCGANQPAKTSHPSWKRVWPAFLDNSARTGVRSGDPAITASSFRHLSPGWMQPSSGSVSSEPIVVGRDVFWGSWDGVEHATSLSGKTVWETNLGRTKSHPSCPSQDVGVAGAASFGMMRRRGKKTPLVFVPGGDARVYALDARDGSVVWSRDLEDKSQSVFLWSAPLTYRGHVYVAVSSLDDCPLSAGAVVELDGATGRLLHQFDVVPSGCVGATIWASPTLDTKHGSLYVVTGNPGRCRTHERFGEAMVELSARNLSVRGSWTIPKVQRGGDSDFGATPTIFSADIQGHATTMVGAVDKNGLYYAFRAGHVSAGPRWTKRIGVGGDDPTKGTGDIAASAWDGSRLYVAGERTHIRGQTCAGSIRAMQPTTGRILWATCLPGPVLAPVTGLPGLLVVAAGRQLIGVAASTGRRVGRIRVAGGQFWAAPAFTGTDILEGSMNGGLMDFSLSTG